MRRAGLLLLCAVPLLAAHAAPPHAVPPHAAPPGDAIRVRGISGDTVVSLLPTEGGGLVRVDVLARLLGGSLDSVAAGRWRLTLYATSLELHEGAPFASYNGYPLPLSEATRVVGGQPYASLQLFSEIIPRFGIGILWDQTRWELRLFQAIARGAVPRAITPEANAPEANAPKGLSRKYKVVVDAGHGGVDPGNPGSFVNGRRVREAELTLAISLKLEKELTARGLDVYMTRRTDTLIALNERGHIANSQKADLFISIHTNAANPSWQNGTAVRGFETYFLSEARTEDERRVAAMENDVVRFETTVDAKRGDPLSFLIADIAQNEHLRESSDFAATIQQRLRTSHPGPNRGVKQAGLAVLAQAFMPAVLVEIGFGSNPADARWMASAAGQRSAVVALADATLEYLAHYERRVRPSRR